MTSSQRRPASGLRYAFALGLPALLAGCSLLPSAGPDRGDIRRQTPTFVLVDLAPATLPAAATASEAGFAARFGNAAAGPAVIAVGDSVAVEIWEAGSDTLFTARNPAGASGGASRNVGLPEQTVGPDGTVLLPFVGRLPVIGLGALDVEQKITDALAGKAARPQVLVQLRQASRAVTVTGDVAGAARVPLSARGERLLDVLTAVGGLRVPAHEARLTLTRAGESASLPLLRLLEDPRENIPALPGDLMVATRQPQSFTAFGATGRNAQIEFGAERVSLIEAVAKTGGLLDERADPRGVYLLRHEPRAALEALQLTVPADAMAGDSVRVVYRLDLSEARSYFLGQQFTLRDHDILYVSNAATNELTKFLQLVGLLSQPVIQGAVMREALK